MADCDRNREACVLDNTSGGVPPPEEPLPPPQASRASAPVAASPSLASAAPASVSAAAVFWATLAACGSRAATIRSLMITWRLPVATPLPRSANARYGSRLTRWSSGLAGPRRLEEASTVIGRARYNGDMWQSPGTVPLMPLGSAADRAGPGPGSSAIQRRLEFVDTLAFMLWQFGDPEFQPRRREGN